MFSVTLDWFKVLVVVNALKSVHSEKCGNDKFLGTKARYFHLILDLTFIYIVRVIATSPNTFPEQV